MEPPGTGHLCGPPRRREMAGGNRHAAERSHVGDDCFLRLRCSGKDVSGKDHVGTAALGCPAKRSSAVSGAPRRHIAWAAPNWWGWTRKDWQIASHLRSPMSLIYFPATVR